MTDTIFEAGLMVCAVGMLGSFLRLVRGPALADRVLAIDALAVQSLTVFAGLALAQRRVEILEPVLVVALVGFVTTVALARLIQPPSSK
jgi:multisubunit Na+/H+ antiporter MnhF subunit